MHLVELCVRRQQTICRCTACAATWRRWCTGPHDPGVPAGGPRPAEPLPGGCARCYASHAPAFFSLPLQGGKMASVFPSCYAWEPMSPYAKVQQPIFKEWEEKAA